MTHDFWFSFEHFEAQTMDVIDLMEVKHPGVQLLIEVDWSSGHGKMAEGSLSAQLMNVNPNPNNDLRVPGGLKHGRA